MVKLCPFSGAGGGGTLSGKLTSTNNSTGTKKLQTFRAKNMDFMQWGGGGNNHFSSLSTVVYGKGGEAEVKTIQKVQTFKVIKFQTYAIERATISPAP